MSQGLYVLDITFPSTNDLSTTGQYLIAKKDSTEGQIVLAAASTDKIIGIIQNKPKALEGALVRVLGTSKLKAGGTVHFGDFVTSDGSGQGIATVTNKDVIVGMSLAEAVSADLFEVMLVHFTLST